MRRSGVGTSIQWDRGRRSLCGFLPAMCAVSFRVTRKCSPFRWLVRVPSSVKGSSCDHFFNSSSLIRGVRMESSVPFISLTMFSRCRYKMKREMDHMMIMVLVCR